MSTIKSLEKKIFDISYRNKLSHIGSCLTALPIILEIYQTKEPEDKVIISCGHCHLAHAVVMEHFGFIESAEENVKKYGIHCEREGGCDCSTGSLGQGLPIALGMALANRDRNVWCLISDGEMTEGGIYEALHIKKKYEAYNLKIYCNYNGWGAYDKSEEYLPHLLSGVKVCYTNNHWFIEKYQQEAHYKALNQQEYEEIIRNYFT